MEQKQYEKDNVLELLKNVKSWDPGSPIKNSNKLLVDV